METVAAVLIFALVIASMAVGVIFMRRPIAGSCGGLNNLEGGDGSCQLCGKTSEERQECQKQRKVRQA